MKQKTDWLNVVKYAGAYIAFIIGSGFATGQEIIQFYTSYGIWGIGSIAISMFLFAWVGGTVTDMGFRTKGMEKVNAYGQICGKWLGTFYEYFVRIFLFAVVVVMISGAGATLNEYYGLNYYVGSLLMAVLIFVAFAFGFNKLLDVIGCIGPVIIVFSIVVAVATIVSGSGLDLNVDITPIANMRSSANWWISGILYASYNIFGAIPFLTTMGAGSTSAREVKLGGILGGVVLMTAVLFMNAALLLRVDEIAQFAVPTLRLAKDISPVLGALFSVVLLCGIFSTAAPHDVDGVQQAGAGGNQEVYRHRGGADSGGLWAGSASVRYIGRLHLPLYGLSGHPAAGVSGSSAHSRLYQKKQHESVS